MLAEMRDACHRGTLPGYAFRGQLERRNNLLGTVGNRAAAPRDAPRMGQQTPARGDQDGLSANDLAPGGVPAKELVLGVLLIRAAVADGAVGVETKMPCS